MVLVPKKIKDVVEFVYDEVEDHVGIITQIYTWESINEFLDLVISDQIDIILRDEYLRQVKSKNRYIYKILSGDNFFIMDHYWYGEERKKTEMYHIDQILYN